MSIRQVMNEKPALVIVAVLVVIGAAAWIVVGSTKSPKVGGGMVYFSADDGETYFADKAATVTPYTKDGKQVVRAYVYKCKDGKPFVGRLSRQNPNAPLTPGSEQDTGAAGREVKRPGDSAWQVYGRMSPADMAKMRVLCPDGTTPELASP
jgi:hypothetical protein